MYMMGGWNFVLFADELSSLCPNCPAVWMNLVARVHRLASVRVYLSWHLCRLPPSGLGLPPVLGRCSSNKVV